MSKATLNMIAESLRQQQKPWKFDRMQINPVRALNGACLPTYLSVWLSVCLPVGLPPCPFPTVCLSVCLCWACNCFVFLACDNPSQWLELELQLELLPWKVNLSALHCSVCGIDMAIAIAIASAVVVGAVDAAVAAAAAWSAAASSWSSSASSSLHTIVDNLTLGIANIATDRQQQRQQHPSSSSINSNGNGSSSSSKRSNCNSCSCIFSLV